MFGPFTTASRLTPIHQMSLAVLSRAACASMSTTPTTTTTTTRDRGDRYGPMEWAQLARQSEQTKVHVRRRLRPTLIWLWEWLPPINAWMLHVVLKSPPMLVQVGLLMLSNVSHFSPSSRLVTALSHRRLIIIIIIIIKFFPRCLTDVRRHFFCNRVI